MPDEIAYKDPINRQPMTIRLVRRVDLEVIGHQRKPRPAHLKALASSFERGVKEFPVVVVPEKLARRMMSLNIEQSLNIRERSTIALSIYRDILEETPGKSEDNGDVVDAIETAHLVTLGLAYERSGRLAGSAFEILLKKCDGFLDQPLARAYETREERAEKLLEAARHVKAVEDALKARGAWHSMARYQIISYANPTKRARKPADFDGTFAKFIANLEALEESPQRVLGERTEAE